MVSITSCLSVPMYAHLLCLKQCTLPGMPRDCRCSMCDQFVASPWMISIISNTTHPQQWLNLVCTTFGRLIFVRMPALITSQASSLQTLKTCHCNYQLAILSFFIFTFLYGADCCLHQSKIHFLLPPLSTKARECERPKADQEEENYSLFLFILFKL